MPEANLNPYLSFNGNCREAMEFYASVLGGELKTNTFGEIPMEGTPEGYEDKIMHSVLENDTLTFMASDSPPGMDHTVGNHITMSISGNDGDRMRKFWDGLSEGGQVAMPLAPQVWGDEFGMFVDKFGISWMINISAQ